MIFKNSLSPLIYVNVLQQPNKLDICKMHGTHTWSPNILGCVTTSDSNLSRNVFNISKVNRFILEKEAFCMDNV